MVKSFEELPPAFDVEVFRESLGVKSQKTAYKIMKKHNLGIRVTGKKWVVLKERVLAWIDTQSEQAKKEYQEKAEKCAG